MLHVGNYSWQPLSKAPGIVNIGDCMGRSRVALCALQSHSCGEGKPLQPLISACSPLRKNNNKLLAFCLYGIWLPCVLISGLAMGAALTHWFKNTAAVASGDGFDSRESFLFFFFLSFPFSNRGVCFPYRNMLKLRSLTLWYSVWVVNRGNCCFNCKSIFSTLCTYFVTEWMSVVHQETASLVIKDDFIKHFTLHADSLMALQIYWC